MVVSPHCDDAVLSLGAALSAHARSGGIVTVLTVLAGDPDSTQPAGPWDARAGFRTAGQAARARRREDREACRLLGVGCVQLDGPDQQYSRPEDDRAALARQLVTGLAGCEEVLVPSWPLRHPDHLLARDLALDAVPRGAEVRGYREQPYASWTGQPCPHPWSRPAASDVDERRKTRAVAAYRSQVRVLAEPFPLPVVGVCRAGLLGQLRLAGEAVRDETGAGPAGLRGAPHDRQGQG